MEQATELVQLQESLGKVMSKHKKVKMETPKRMTAREWIAQQTNTDPLDWDELTTGTKLYAKGYRYRNRNTGQMARRPEHARQSP